MKTLILLLLTLQFCSAQLIVTLKPEKDQFVAHEDTFIILTITNRAGKSLTLQGKDRKNWLNINVKSQGGEILPYKGGRPTFKAVIIAAGQTITKKIPLQDFYDLKKFGRYQVTAFVSLPGDSRDAIRSNTGQFLVTSGRTLFSQKVGLPNTANARKFEVINFSGSKTTELYVKITNQFTGKVTSCEALSQIITFRDPQAALDKQNNLHLLYLITPTLYTHFVVTPTGKIVKRNYHKQGAIGEPRLESFSDGNVKVANTLPYNPTKMKKEAEKRGKLSDRPNLVF